jgi:hypothetical protein
VAYIIRKVIIERGWPSVILGPTKIKKGIITEEGHPSCALGPVNANKKEKKKENGFGSIHLKPIKLIIEI